MPFIDLKVTPKITSAKEEVIKDRLGEAISVIGKDEKWLMVNIEDGCRMYFGGDKKVPMAFIGVSVFGHVEKEKYAFLTSVLSDIMLTEIGIPKTHVYIRYTETENWGWNGSNF